MAFLVKTRLFFFLLVLISSLQIQARESKFFKKFTHISVKSRFIPESQISQTPRSAPALAPTPAEAVPTIAAEPVTAPAEAPASFYAESDNGDGVHGHGHGQFPPTKETVQSTTNENDLFHGELTAESYETGHRNSNYRNNVYNNNYYANGHVTEKQGMSDTIFTQNYQNSNYNNEYNSDTNYNENKYTRGNNYNSNNEYINGNNYNSNEYTNGNNNNDVYASNYNGNGYSNNYNTRSYDSERKGMSDTRFLENGNYYDFKNENNYFPNEFASQREIATNEGYYGNTQNENEFNTMEEFENEKYEP